jgi:hypothetical protein
MQIANDTNNAAAGAATAGAAGAAASGGGTMSRATSSNHSSAGFVLDLGKAMRVRMVSLRNSKFSDATGFKVRHMQFY